MPEHLLTPVDTTPQQPTYPSIQLNVVPEGMTVTVLIAPGIVGSSVSINADMMHQVCHKWRELQRESKQSLETIQAVMRSRVN